MHGRSRIVLGAVLVAGALMVGPTVSAQAATPSFSAMEPKAASAAPTGDGSGPLDGCYEGSWLAEHDPICASFLQRKDVCRAWEGQWNTEFGTRNEFCKYLP